MMTGWCCCVTLSTCDYKAIFQDHNAKQLCLRLGSEDCIVVPPRNDTVFYNM